MFRLRVLGGFALGDSGGMPVPTLHHRRAMAVLSMLAVHGDLGCTRERLLALLWPESDEAHARHGLRDALHAIRQALTPGSVRSVASLLCLDPSVVGADVMEFSCAIAAGRLAEAVPLYGGPLLDGFHVDGAPEFERWLDSERARLSREFVAALERLATAAEGSGDWGAAAGWWGRAIEHDPLKAQFVLRQMQALTALGDRATAIRAADLHARRLREEFDLTPDPEVLDRVERIRNGGTAVPPGDAMRPVPVRAPAPAPQEVEVPGGHAPPPAPAGPVPGRSVRWVRWVAGVAALGGLIALVQLARGRVPRTAGVGPPRAAIAVLPFRNLTADTARAYFAAGLHDELLTQLNRVAALRVVGRTSVSGYQDTAKSLPQIGEELGIGSIVEGSVQVIGNRLRVTVQLFDAATGTALWAERYDRQLDDAFEVQSDIARRIVAAVGATLSSAEGGAIAAAPTRDPEAYQLYLQGLEYRRRPGLLRRNWELAQQLFERALVLDSSFAPAHAALSVVHWAMYGLGYDPSPARLEQARREADWSLRLAGDLPEGHLAGGLARLVGGRDFRGALDEFKLGLRGAPNDPELWAWVAAAHRTLGQWDSAATAFDRARSLDPRNANLLQSIGDTYHYIHQYREAVEAYRHALALAPDVLQTRLSIAWSYILWKGELDTLRAVLDGLPLEADPGMGGWSVGTSRLGLLLLQRRPDSVLALVRAMRPPVRAGAWPPWDFGYWYWAELAHRLRGDTAAAAAVLRSAAAVLDAEVRARPGHYETHASRGLVLAKLGRRTEALREAHWLAQSDEQRRNYFGDAGEARAAILMLTGETDAALVQLEQALAGPSRTTAPYLRLAPAWDPIRSEPRFQALLRKYATPGT